MPFETLRPIENDFNKINKFAGLFDAINSQKLSEEYRDAYEEGVDVAKNLVNTKSKFSWDEKQFDSNITTKYPSLTGNFVEALKRCIKSYNPPINLPNEPLWE